MLYRRREGERVVVDVPVGARAECVCGNPAHTQTINESFEMIVIKLDVKPDCLDAKTAGRTVGTAWHVSIIGHDDSVIDRFVVEVLPNL